MDTWKKGAAVIAGIAGGYTFVFRPRMLRWGATREEFEGPFPGEDIVPGERHATMATTIDAPPSKVWPWLAQMGVDRGGWYSWDRLDNFGRKSTWELHPEWQEAAVGDRFISKPDGSEWWEVAALEPERLLILRASVDLKLRTFDPHAEPPRYYSDSTWGFLLNELPDGKTRLVVSGYWDLRPKWLQPILSFLILEPSHWIMQMRQFQNLKRRVARTTAAEVDAPPVSDIAAAEQFERELAETR